VLNEGLEKYPVINICEKKTISRQIDALNITAIWNESLFIYIKII